MMSSRCPLTTSLPAMSTRTALAPCLKPHVGRPQVPPARATAPSVANSEPSLMTSSYRSGSRTSSALSPPAALPVWRHLGASAAALAASLVLGTSFPAHADLNVLEAEAGGEFGRGTAQQYGEADVSGRDFSGQDMRRSNFTSAECRRTNFRGANLQGSYFIKAVTPFANFQDANLSDVLMDRAVMVEADLTNAILERAVFTRSDFRDAKITGADFTNALIDRTQQLALCRYADGTNKVTGVSTRKSLGCGSVRKFRSQSPSNPDGPQVTTDEQNAFRATMPVYRE